MGNAAVTVSARRSDTVARKAFVRKCATVAPHRAERPSTITVVSVA